MKAMILKQFGGVENFAVKDIPEPRLSEGKVLIRVKAIGINPIDLKTRQGVGMASQYKGAQDQDIVLGWDVAGVITHVVEDIGNFKLGDEVFGTINFPGRGGGYAEYALAPANQIAKKPSNITTTEAAAATLSTLTAWQALIDTGHISRSQRVLIHGGAGGVGNYAIQIAKYVGCYVITTAAAADATFVKGIGADEVIDYKTQKFEEMVSDIDFILDTIGGENFTRSLKVLKPNGTIVLLPSDKKAEADKAAEEHNTVNYKHIVVHSDGEEMNRIAGLLSSGNIKVHVDKTFPFDEIPQAHSELEKGKVRGKIVITVP